MKLSRPLPLVCALLFAALSPVSCRGGQGRSTAAGPARPGRPIQLTTGASVEVYPAFSPDGLSLAYSSNETGVFEIYVRTLQSPSRSRKITSDGKENLQSAWAPDGTRLAFHSKGRGGIWLIPVEGGKATPLTDFGTRPSWSPDGKWIAFQVHAITDLSAMGVPSLPSSTIWVVPSRGGPARQVTEPGKPSGGHGNPVFSGDSDRIFFTSSNSKLFVGELWLVSLGGGSPKRLFSQRRLFDPAVSADGRNVYFGDHSSDFLYGLWRMRLSSSGQPLQKPELVAQLAQTVARHPTISPDGRTVVWSALSTTGNIWSLPLGPRGEPAGAPRPLTREQARNTWPVFSPSGKSIAFGRSWPGLNPDIWTMDADGQNRTQITTSPTAELIGDWLPDGRRLFFVNHRAKKSALWTIDTITRKEEPLPLPDREFGSPRISPDAKRLAYQTKKGSNTTNIWVADLTTGERKQLTFDREFIGFPCWSPDGKFLAIQVTRGDDVMVAIVPSEGGDPVQLTFDRGLSWPFSWSPDGDKIAFAGSRNDRWAVWWVSRSTLAQQRLTPEVPLNAYVRYPGWSPRGDQLVYEYGATTGHLFMMQMEE